MLRLPLILLLLLLASCQEKDPWRDDASLPEKISFNQHIRPLLQRDCLQCHGSERSEGGLRLDLPSGVSSVVTENSPRKSRLWEMIQDNHPAPLSEREQALFWRWIRQDTPSEGHWASLPIASETSPIARLADESLVGESEFSFLFNALLGRQPSQEDFSRWTEMQAPRAALIDSLMAEPDFAPNFRTRLLLLSGTNPVPDGTPFDPYFRWIESEIAAPDFSLQTFFRMSLAGDLVPESGEQGALASAWTRLPSRTDLGTLPRRIGRSFLDLDLTREAQPTDLWPDAAITLPLFMPKERPPFQGNIATPPFLPLYTPQQSSALETALVEEETLWQRAGEIPPAAELSFREWLAEQEAIPIIPDLVTALTFDEGKPLNSSPMGEIDATGPLQLLPGVQSTAVAAPASFTGVPLDSAHPFTFSFFLRVPELPTVATPVFLAETDQGAPVGFRLSLSTSELSLQLLNGSDENSLSVTTQTLPTPGHWHHFAIAYDGSRRASGLQLWIDSVALPLTITHDSLFGIAQSPDGRLQFAPILESLTSTLLDEVQIYQRLLSELELIHLRDGTSLFAAVRDEFPREDLLLRYYLSSQYPPFRAAIDSAASSSRKVGILQDSALLVPIAVQEELPSVRPTLPFHPLPMTSDANRLGLADWLFNDRNPVTPRVLVSRLYQMIYGIALLPQSADLSDPWQLPPNLQLLDFLARDLIKNDWELRAILKTILLNPPPTLS